MERCAIKKGDFDLRSKMAPNDSGMNMAPSTKKSTDNNDSRGGEPSSYSQVERALSGSSSSSRPAGSGEGNSYAKSPLPTIVAARSLEPALSPTDDAVTTSINENLLGDGRSGGGSAAGPDGEPRGSEMTVASHNKLLKAESESVPLSTLPSEERVESVGPVR